MAPLTRVMVIPVALAWAAGLWLGRAWPLPLWAWLMAAGAAGVLAVGLRRRAVGRVLFCVGLMALGAGRLAAAVPRVDADHVATYHRPEPVVLRGVVVREPRVGGGGQRLRLRADQIIPAGGAPRPVRGDVLVELPRYPLVEYGTRLTVRGRLESPPETPEFSLRAVLAREGITSQMRRPRLVRSEAGHGAVWLTALLAVKERAAGVIDRLFPAPESGLLRGILLGTEDALTRELAEDFRATGITHIVVISGFNISIIAALFLAAATPLLGQKGAAYAAMGGIAAYTVLVGGDAAVVRAAIMGGLYVVSERLLGRRSYAFAALFAAGLAMTVVNPFALWDIGFQLSFAATLSLILYAGPLAERVHLELGRRLPGPWAGRVVAAINEAILVTLAAQVLTLPLLIYYFEQVSLISLLANALILPAQPAVMIWGGLATLVGLVSPGLAQPLAWVATLFLGYTIRLAHLLAQVPWAVVGVSLSAWGLGGVYLSIGLLTWVGGQEAERRATIWGTVRRHLRLQTALWGCAFVVILGWRWQTTRPDGLLQVVFFELTEGSAALIQSPTGRQILVDGGRYPSELAQRLGEHLPFGDRTLDLVIVTGLDNGRLGGLPALFGRYEVGEIWVPGEPPARNDTWGALLAAAETSGTPVRDIVEEEAVVVGDGLRLAVAGVNEGAAGLALTFGDFMLATGRGEGWLAAEVVEVDSRVPPEALLSFRPRLSSSTLGTIQVRTDGRRMWWIAYR